MTSHTTILRVAIDAPLMRLFDYLAPEKSGPTPVAGQRVRVPFGKSTRTGVIAGLAQDSLIPSGKLRHAEKIIDPEPLLDDSLLELLNWTATYYQHPIGEVYATALPVLLRRGKEAAGPATRWFMTAEGQRTELEVLQNRAPLQAKLLAAMRDSSTGITREALDLNANQWRSAVRGLTNKGLIERRAVDTDAQVVKPSNGPQLNGEQTATVAAIRASQGFAAFLLAGITGSGKTEVYLECIAAQIAAGKQSLVLVPEIGLTPQLVRRFRQRLGVPISVLHSGLNKSERLQAWCAAQRGASPVIVGTRSAVFTPLARPGLLVVDEEHDASFKQQDGLRYSARDLGVWRAKQLAIPIVLGSATPSFESLDNAENGRYQQLELRQRPGIARQPQVQIIDLQRNPARDGLSEPLLAAIHRHLNDDGQVLIYLNRRGYSPSLMCTVCGQVAECRRCDARMVYHRHREELICHHCGAERSAPSACEDCKTSLFPVGQGTERLETALGELFADFPLIRIDRDTTRRKGEIARRLDLVRSGEARLVLGTQMLTKGHDFPNVTLVGVIDADQGLFGTDFRSSERLAQSFIQVAGRAGRADRPGEVLIQSLFPQHPLLQLLLREGYATFAQAALTNRRDAGWPPFGYLALLRAEATQRDAVFEFLEQAQELAMPTNKKDIQLLGPAPAPMERRAGRYRGQLLIRAPLRSSLQQFLQPWRLDLETLRDKRRVRWSLDVDPAELF